MLRSVAVFIKKPFHFSNQLRKLSAKPPKMSLGYCSLEIRYFNCFEVFKLKNAFCELKVSRFQLLSTFSHVAVKYSDVANCTASNDTSCKKCKQMKSVVVRHKASQEDSIPIYEMNMSKNTNSTVTMSTIPYHKYKLQHVKSSSNID